MRVLKPFKKKTIFLFGILVSLVIIGQCKNFPYNDENHPDDIEVISQWDLPQVLNEISGIAYLSENQIACVQDELGSVFIFDTNSKKIIKKIDFGEKGDYEGITIVEQTIFILRSDGSLFELTALGKGNGKAKIHASPFSKGNDFEGLTYDKRENRLLISMKESKEKNQFRGIYAFNLETKTFEKEPVVKLEFPYEDENLKFRPSEIAWTENGIFLLTSKNPAIIRYENEIPKEVYFLDENQFPQPEGLTFGENGKIFLSSEGSPGKLFQIELKKK
ncbi:MAG TPA: SdiA-regulated domain-containing protein [Flavobacteriaceae bacterium]|nr:SdiA-regulated domain-containing protein [Flavobacteriaceae bacterium]